jgi:E3 ubiquitin-protein ligase BRE1
MDGKNSQHKAKMEALLKDVDKAKSRCEELATESTRLHEEKQKMMELLAIAQREANDAVKASQGLTGSSGGGGGGGIGIPSEFTAEQLSTQVSVLKSRLVCPVCNCRDKKCILLRCRHMFCRACVDESIKNRSRKCPACGGRFDSKDVADVWL